MLTMYTAHTEEVDDVEKAADEILAQIDVVKLAQNSVGILFCHYEFVESGVVEAVCARLPFEVIGMTTMSGMTPAGYGEYRLNLSVLTADDVSFQVAATEITGAAGMRKSLTDAYGAARRKLPGDPAMILSFFPFFSDIASVDMLAAFDAACGGIPIWGSIASGPDMTYDLARTLINGREEEKSVVMLLLHGSLNPEFVVTSIPDRNIGDRRAVITASDGCVLKTVNDKNLLEFLKEIGITWGRDNTTIPLMVDYGDGSAPVALAIYGLTEEGWAVCGGQMPVGSSFFCGEIDSEGILETARISINKLLDAKRKNGMLMLPCITRYVMLTPNQNDEMKLVRDMLGDTIPYALALSGGELCPVTGGDGKLRNRFHNYTFSACVF